MNNITEVLAIIFPVVLSLAVGIILKTKNIVSEEGINGIKQMILCAFLPAALFNTFYNVDFSWQIIIVCISMILVILVALQLGKFFKFAFKSKYELTPYLCTTIEGGMLGYALFILLFGAENLYYMALVDLGTALVLFLYIATKFKIRYSGNVTLKSSLKMLVSPINCAIVSGLFVNFIGLGDIIASSSAGYVLESGLSFLGAPIGTLILISIGYGIDLSEIDIKETFKTVLARAIIFTLMGFIMYNLISYLLPTLPLYSYAVIMACILPPSYALSVFIEEKDENAHAGSVLTVYTLLTLIAFGIFAFFVA